eukprot:CAMPEP_0116019714 /NCGR_PEP_ID=MMETSP0321-20121206/9392_1 /TAXON_ID=163516 /ORGANISM="Leptocylindrus danicus var. danicus, Strain B650" /LENGTH=134 /DNA_ID=CAMNT_0003490319 /DNA_START=106 /DNA_END=510 /DNA_ORIENTATION=+
MSGHKGFGVGYTGQCRTSAERFATADKTWVTVLKARSKDRDEEKEDDFEYEYTEYYDDEIIDIDFDDDLPAATVEARRDPDFGNIPISDVIKKDPQIVKEAFFVLCFIAFTYEMQKLASISPLNTGTGELILPF